MEIRIYSFVNLYVGSVIKHLFNVIFKFKNVTVINVIFVKYFNIFCVFKDIRAQPNIRIQQLSATLHNTSRERQLRQQRSILATYSPQTYYGSSSPPLRPACASHVHRPVIHTRTEIFRQSSKDDSRASFFERIHRSVFAASGRARRQCASAIIGFSEKKNATERALFRKFLCMYIHIYIYK